ncbi:unnamed protein product [Closterium sp. Yama58-4]|nr:unnamed protein product [Closterium sp. Yama58-4]
MHPRLPPWSFPAHSLSQRPRIPFPSARAFPSPAPARSLPQHPRIPFPSARAIPSERPRIPFPSARAFPSPAPARSLPQHPRIPFPSARAIPSERPRIPFPSARAFPSPAPARSLPQHPRIPFPSTRAIPSPAPAHFLPQRPFSHCLLSFPLPKSHFPLLTPFPLQSSHFLLPHSLSPITHPNSSPCSFSFPLQPSHFPLHSLSLFTHPISPLLTVIHPTPKEGRTVLVTFGNPTSSPASWISRPNLPNFETPGPRVLNPQILPHGFRFWPVSSLHCFSHSPRIAVPPSAPLCCTPKARRMLLSSGIAGSSSRSTKHSSFLQPPSSHRPASQRGDSPMRARGQCRQAPH